MSTRPRSRRSWRRHKKALVADLAVRLRQLADRGVVHRDCKAQNMLVVTQPRLALLWIDMDGLRLVRRASMADQLRALTRLHVSLLDVPGLTRTDRARFLKAYFARFGADTRVWREAWRQISFASEQKLSALDRRRAWKLKHYGRA